MTLIAYPSREALNDGLAAALAADLDAALVRAGKGGRVSLCLSGGSSVERVYRLLGQAPLAWDRVTVFLNDERWVPPEHAQSNGGMLARTLLAGRAGLATVVPLFTADRTAHDGVPAVTQALRPHLPIDVLLLGMGEDMHTASIFPDSPQAAQALAADAPPVMAISAPSQQLARITLTAPVLAAARAGHLVITGAAKRAALAQAAGLDPAKAPIAAILPMLTVHWGP